ncbi:MAG TPA: carbohydrate-binding domain-containing protein [Gemmataceae bacterium]|nr:carbohydrate-binding domain-containing protein [Gemmataceae bacterium]
MVRYACVAALVVAIGGGVALAADPGKVELKAFKMKPAFDGGESLVGYNDGEEKLFFYTNGTATADIKIDDEAEYTITLDASCDEAQKKFAQIKVKAGDAVVKDKFDLTQAAQKEYKFEVKLKKGEHKLSFEFLNDTYKENEYDLNFYIHGVKVEKKK